MDPELYERMSSNDLNWIRENYEYQIVRTKRQAEETVETLEFAIGLIDSELSNRSV